MKYLCVSLGIPIEMPLRFLGILIKQLFACLEFPIEMPLESLTLVDKGILFILAVEAEDKSLLWIPCKSLGIPS